MSAAAVASRYINAAAVVSSHQPAAVYEADSRSFLPIHSSTHYHYQHSTPPLFSSPLPFNAPSDFLSDFCPDSFTFESPPDYSLDSPLPPSYAGDSPHSSSGSSLSLAAIDSSSPSIPSLLTAPVETSAVDGTPSAVRRRRTGRSSSDRLQQKRRKQRECDVDRRQRENTALVQLQQFIQEEEAEEQQAEDESQHETVDTSSKRHKADVLQQSVQLIEILKRRVAELTAASADSPHSPPPQPRLSHLASSTLAAHLRQASLHSPMRGDHSTVCLMLLHSPTNRILDVTPRLLTCMGWQRNNIVGRRWPQLHTRRDSSRRVGLRDDAVLVAGKGGVGLVASRQEPQYERSIRLRQQLYSGAVDRIEAVWRAQLADGRLYEFAATSWVSEWEEVECGSGGSGVKKRQPYHAMSVVSGTELVCVE